MAQDAKVAREQGPIDHAGGASRSTSWLRMARRLLMNLMAVGALLGLLMSGASPAAAADLNTAPLGSIATARSPYEVAFDSVGQMYVASERDHSVTVYEAGWPASGATVVKTLTGLGGVVGLALDGEDNLYVAGWGPEIRMFAKGWAGGDSAPTKVLAGDKTFLIGAWDIAFDGQGRMYVSQFNQVGAITVYSGDWISEAATQVNVAPVNVLFGVDTGLTAPLGIAVDGPGNVYVADLMSGDVSYFSHDWVEPNTAPTKILAGDLTGITSPGGVALDANGNLYLSGVNDDTIRVFAAGWTSVGTTPVNVAPVAVLIGDKTELQGPFRMAIPGSNLLYVPNIAANTVTAYPLLSPVITAVSPTSGSSTGGTRVTITGGGFVTGTTATVGGAECSSVTLTSSTSMTCTTGAHAAGAADVVVSTGGGQTAKAGGFTFVASPGTPPRPTATAGDRRATVSVSPPTSGGPVLSYSIRADHAGGSCTITVPARSCSVTGLTNGVSYRFTATASNAGGMSTPSAKSAPVTPTAPCALRVSALPATSVVPASGTTTLVGFATTSPGCQLRVFASNRNRGDLRPATYAIDRSTGRVTVTTRGLSGFGLNVAIAGVPTKPAYRPSKTWTRHWTTG